ncbi:MAG: hypothetical protein AUI58_02300 [Chloroflexi bacterium 13_1_40CM_2_70_6]|nr:MAG: hypothetical protein AUI58_02300 [Chloroflexi bacterium 13_1_40CM_2_70_6]OLE76283.1 MAG: hypothetical protein AUG02_05300 [Chloroflexi bacterium 13_1_20CM_2_70_9]
MALACAPATQSAVAPPIPGAPEVIVIATEMRFSPGEVVLPAREVNLTVRNTGSLPHDLTVPGLGIYLLVQPGQAVTTGLRDLPRGRYDGQCGIQGHAAAGMAVAITVE